MNVQVGAINANFYIKGSTAFPVAFRIIPQTVYFAKLICDICKGLIEVRGRSYVV